MRLMEWSRYRIITVKTRRIKTAMQGQGWGELTNWMWVCGVIMRLSLLPIAKWGKMWPPKVSSHNQDSDPVSCCTGWQEAERGDLGDAVEKAEGMQIGLVGTWISDLFIYQMLPRVTCHAGVQAQRCPPQGSQLLTQHSVTSARGFSRWHPRPAWGLQGDPLWGPWPEALPRLSLWMAAACMALGSLNSLPKLLQCSPQ